MSTMTMNSLRKMLCDELEEIVNTGHISGSDLQTVHVLTDSIKNIDKIEHMEEEGYSYNGDWKATGTYSNGRHYVRGHYSNANEEMMLTERIESMMRNPSLSNSDKDVLKRAMVMLRG